MQKCLLECAYHISKFKYHNTIKKELLSLLDTAPFKSPNEPQAETNITKTDWYNSQDFDREWVKLINPALIQEHMLSVYKDLGYDGFTLHEIWFQQYLNNSGHGWHTHSSNFTNVYYVELPKDSPPTKIVNPYNQTDIIELEVEEGDVVVFPSFAIHKGPQNISNSRKTILSYNTNIVYSDNIYGQGLEE